MKRVLSAITVCVVLAVASISFAQDKAVDKKSDKPACCGGCKGSESKTVCKMDSKTTAKTAKTAKKPAKKSTKTTKSKKN